MSVVNRCEQLWNSLSEIEQHCLKQMQQGALNRASLDLPYSPQQLYDALEWLVRKGVLIEVQRNRSYYCFSSLLASYITQRFSSLTPGLRIDFVRKQVWIDGVLLSGHLTSREFQLLSFLAEHRGNTCSRAATVRAVYGNEYVPRLDDARLDALVERTRKQIGDDPRAPRFLITVRGEGHKLNEYLG
jgi:DNA-binding response OmpR family regulator